MCRSIEPNHISWFKLLYKWCISSRIILCKPWVELLLSWVHSTYLFILYKWVFKTRMLSHFKTNLKNYIFKKKNFSPVRDSWWQIIYLFNYNSNWHKNAMSWQSHTQVSSSPTKFQWRGTAPTLVAQYKAPSEPAPTSSTSMDETLLSLTLLDEFLFHGWLVGLDGRDGTYIDHQPTNYNTYYSRLVCNM
jgi:hypothetical protein